MSDNNINTASVVLKKVRISPRKLVLVTNMVKGLKVEQAIRDLTFCKKAVSGVVAQCLRSAVANAENNFGLDIDSLVVSKVTVGKALLMKRYRPRAKGRAGRINKFFSNLYITVKELEAE